jgi:hypothetical protein
MPPTSCGGPDTLGPSDWSGRTAALGRSACSGTSATATRNKCVAARAIFVSKMLGFVRAEVASSGLHWGQSDDLMCV